MSTKSNVPALPSVAFRDEASAHWRNVAADAELQAAFLELDAVADAVMRRTQGQLWAVAMGLPPDRGALFEILTYSSEVELRRRAVSLIGRALGQVAVAA